MNSLLMRSLLENITPQQFVVVDLLYDNPDFAGASMTEIEAVTGFSTSALKTHLKDLVDKGYLQRTYTTHGRALYFANEDKLPKMF